jgi:opacity protein-like surface antigen
MKNIYLILLLAICPMLSLAQSGSYYITNDNSIYAGVEIIDGGDLKNARICQVKKDGEIITFTPYEVNEYGLKDGQVYISTEILSAGSLKRVFLQRLHDGEITLFYLRETGIKTFYIQKDHDLLIEMPKRNTQGESYTSQLLRLTKDCPGVSDATRLVSYKKRPLTKLMQRYDHCEIKPFPRIRYGVSVGYGVSVLVPASEQNELFQNFAYDYNGGSSVGIFINSPILLSDFSAHAEVVFSKHGFSYNAFENEKDLDLVANFSVLNIPVLVRYAYPSNRFRPFINAGLTGTHFLRKETLLYETSISKSIIKINQTEVNSVMNDFHIGYAIGGGIEYKLNLRNSLFLELRYNSQFKQGHFEFLGISAYKITAGINI